MKLDNTLIRSLVVDPATLGSKLRLVSVRPYYEYIDKRRTDNLLGYNYVVTCSGLAGERLAVKIPGHKLLDETNCDSLVSFENFKLGIYCGYVPGKYGIESVNLAASATGISVIGD